MRRQRHPIWLIPAIVALIAGLAFAGFAFFMALDKAVLHIYSDGGGSAQPKEGPTLRGSITLTTLSTISLDSSPECTESGGTGGYSDIYVGAPVVVKDGKGNVVSTGRLERGEALTSFICTYPFVVEQLPRSEFYSIEVSHRGGLTYSHEELEAIGFAVSFSLGNP